jgi:hypothetical protein
MTNVSSLAQAGKMPLLGQMAPRGVQLLLNSDCFALYFVCGTSQWTDRVGVIVLGRCVEPLLTEPAVMLASLLQVLCRYRALPPLH